MNQEQLFEPVETLKPWQGGSYPLYDGTPPHEAPVTSQQAAVSVTAGVNRMQGVVLNAIRDSGTYGMTDDAIEEWTGLKHQTASARRRELYLLGRIRSTGTRPTRSGRKAQVWVIREAN